MDGVWIKLGFENFGFCMFILGWIFIFLQMLFHNKNKNKYDIVFRWTAFFPLGITGIYTAIMHIFFGPMTAAGIGWEPSPFQYEVGIADLTIGILGLLSFYATYPFRLAVVIGAVIWLWGDAVGHIYQMISQQNFAPGNAGSWFWMDILVPLVLVICLRKIKPNRNIF